MHMLNINCHSQRHLAYEFTFCVALIHYESLLLLIVARCWIMSPVFVMPNGKYPTRHFIEPAENS